MCVLPQVTWPGAIDPSAVDTTELHPHLAVNSMCPSAGGPTGRHGSLSDIHDGAVQRSSASFVCVLLQVTRPGAIDPSAVDTTEDQAIIGKARKKVWVLTVVGYCALFILWPCLMAPAGGTWSVGYFRLEIHSS